MQNLASTQKQSWLVWFLKGVLLLGLAVLVARLGELQIIKGEYYQSLADGNRIRRVPILAPRGEILARGGELLVGNKEVKKWVTFNPESGFEKKELTPQTPESEIITEWIRNYTLGEDFAHVSGYLGQVNEEELGKVDALCNDKGPRKLGSMVGRGGLEEQYSCKLRGFDGEEMVEVDTFGKKIRTIGRRQSRPGEQIRTTIDYGLQRKIALVMKTNNMKGAIIATDGKGQILGFYSYPSFDPNAFLQETPDDSKKVAKYLQDPNLPLFNRIIGGAYHPGSVFKIVTAIGALEEGKIDKNFTYDDQGVIRINEFSYANWFFTQYGRVEGKINLAKALARSTDTYFYKVGEMLGAESLSSWAKKFGMGKLTGIDLPGEIAGLVPSPEWKQFTKGERWFLGNTYHMAIGQGDLATTPLEVNIMTSVIANHGKLCTPYVVNTTLSENQKCQDLGLKKENIDEVKKGMIGACTSGGTAFPFFNFDPVVACKTGTAETEEKDKTHAWFSVFAPAENPQIVLTILIEKGGEGSSIAAPLAREILDYWFHADKL